MVCLRRKWIRLAVLTAVMVLTLTGCFIKTVDELYTLPRHSDEYNRLEQAIEQVLSDQNAVYAAPVSGINQQSVQLADLDGDGMDEAIAFLKTKGDKPLKACIFSRSDGDYQLTDVIEGDGTSFACVEYIPLTDGAGVDLVIGRQLSTDVLQSLSAYTYADGRAAELMNASYSEYRSVDLDQDGRRDLFLLREEDEPGRSVAELYHWQDGRMKCEPEVCLTAGAFPVKRILSGSLQKDLPAVFVASAYGGGLVTDIFTMQGGSFRNIMDTDGANADFTVRSYPIYAEDVDNDTLIELPQIVSLPSAQKIEENAAVVNWYQLDADGRGTLKLTTYHNFAGGWFLTLPEQWENQFCVTYSEASEDMRSYTFSRWENGKQGETIVTIYAASGENRNETALADGRMLLAEQRDITYSAQPGDGQWARQLSPDKLTAMFHLIHIDWNSGET